MKINIIGCVGLAFLLGCANPKLEELNFVEVEVQTPLFLDLNSVALRGELLRQGAATTGGCGFFWAYDSLAVVTMSAAAQRINLPLPPADSNGRFAARVDDLERGRSIFVRAFAQITDAEAGERRVFSAEVARVKIGNVVMLTAAATVENDSVRVFGRLLGLKNRVVNTYGHVISATNPLPELGCPNCQNSAYGPANGEPTFHSDFTDLNFNTTYYLRAFAQSDGEIFYSAADTFRVRDGWKRINDFVDLQDAFAVVSGGIAYVGLGCNRQGACLNTEIASCWRFNPSGDGQWESIADYPPPGSGIPRTNTSAFVINGEVYIIFGEYNDVTGSYTLEGFWKYSPVTNQWTQLTDPPGNLSRTGAVHFQINGKTYLGTGIRQTGGNGLFLDDFWEYNPVATNKWRKVASLPMMRNPQAAIITAGRADASAFVVNGQAYVVGGASQNSQEKDVWRFIPPTDSIDLGSWVFVDFFPAERRNNATSFVIGNRAYYGTGEVAGADYVRDWWAFDGQNWTSLTDLPGSKRANAIAFAINGVGYLGTGVTYFPNPNGSFDESTLRDMWRYTPEN